MSVQLLESLQQYLRRLCNGAVMPDDAVLLKRFVADKDRDAFELLIARHGPLVLGTARRLVDNSHDAEDVFQAVFLSLARQAQSIRQGRTLPAWLHKTTCRIAAKARAKRGFRSKESLPEPCEHNDPGAELVWREVRRALDEELQRLPERLRSPLLLCYLSGLTRDEAAKQLGWSLNTLKRRLEESRNLLRTRLERRGIAAVGIALAVLDPKILQAALSKPQVEAILNMIFVKGSVPATISALVLSSSAALKGIAMKSIFALIVAVGLGAGIYAGMGQADTAKKPEEKKEIARVSEDKSVEPSEDPLPAGSTLRFGTSRFRNGTSIASMAVSADGKLAVVSSGYETLSASRVFDLSSGRELFSLDHSCILAVAIAPDAKTIVSLQGLDKPTLFMHDSATGRELRRLELPFAISHLYNAYRLLAFTPEGNAIAVISDRNVVHLVDFKSGKTIREFAHDQDLSAVAFSPDGTLMAAGGMEFEKGTSFARLWDVETGNELRRLVHVRSGQIYALAFSPDGKTVVSGSNGHGNARLFDVATGKERAFFNGSHPIHSVAFAPDGKSIAAASDCIRLYDALTGKERLHIDRNANFLQFTDGGKTLTGAVMGAIYRWDTATGKALTPESAGDSIVRQILVNSDGTRVFTRGGNGDAHVWDGANGKHLRGFQFDSRGNVAKSPDGRFLVWADVDYGVKFADPKSPNPVNYGYRIRLYDVVADKIVDRFPVFKRNISDLALIDDGKTLVTFDHTDGMVRFWNLESGKEERNFQAMPEKQHFGILQTVLSPDGKTLAVAYDQSPFQRPGVGPHIVRLWDVATGKEQHELHAHLHYILDMAFSPDGRLLATAGDKAWDLSRPGDPRKTIDQVFVWDTATGKRVAALPNGLPIGANAVAFSPDSRSLATAEPEGSIRVWEAASWTAHIEFKGHRDQLTALSFTPGGRLLSGSLDTTVLAWDIRPPRITTGSLENAWIDLAKTESRAAFKAEGRFLATPTEATRFFAERIKPAEAPDVKRIRQLIADLDDAKFTVRENASKTLSDLDERTKPYLEEAIKTAKSAELVDRARKILDEPKKITPEQLRQIRAVQVLELINDDESKNLLKKWAGGFKGAVLTEEVTAALKRLEGADKVRR